MAKPPTPQRVVDPQGAVLYTGEDISEGPAGVPAQRAHGVRLGVRPRRLPRPRLHRRLPAPRVRHRPAQLRRRRVGRGRAQDDRGLPHQPPGRAERDAHAHRAAGRRVPRARRSLLALLLRPDDAPRAATGGDHRPHRPAPADRVLRLDGVGGIDRPPGAQLLLHEQLAARAAGRQQADRQRRRVVGAFADRAARRDRAAVRRLRSLAASWAGTAASRPRCRSASRATSRSRRRSARARGSSS